MSRSRRVLSPARPRDTLPAHERPGTAARRIVNETHTASRSDSRSLASSLSPALHQACDGRLGEITWFKTDWQRGGAATGTSTWRLDDEDQPRKAVVKLPIVQRELMWARRLQGAPTPDECVIPRLYASD